LSADIAEKWHFRQQNEEPRAELLVCKRESGSREAYDYREQSSDSLEFKPQGAASAIESGMASWSISQFGDTHVPRVDIHTHKTLRRLTC